MSALPAWAQWTQWAGTIVIAWFVAFIGYRQWRTAHERFVLDLFARRSEIIAGLEEEIRQVVSAGTAPTDLAFRFARRGYPARVVFGADVSEYVESTYKRLVDLDYYMTRLEAHGLSREDLETFIERRYEIFGQIANFFETINKLVEPYMRMHQKMPPPLTERAAQVWNRLRNP
jgi:hypothetical protein